MRIVVAVLVGLAFVVGIGIVVFDRTTATDEGAQADPQSSGRRADSVVEDSVRVPDVDVATRTSGIRDAVEPESDRTDRETGATLTVRLEHADGTPVRGGSLRLFEQWDDGEIAEVVDLDATGAWSGRPERRVDRIDHLGTKAFATEWFGFVDGTTPLVPPFSIDGEDREIRVVVDEGIVVQGVVVDAASGAPIDGATVTMPRLERGFVTPVTTTAQGGRFRIAGFALDPTLDGSRWLVAVKHDAYVPRDVFADVHEGGAPVELRIELDGGLSVSGIVIDGDGALVRGAAIELVARRRADDAAAAWSTLEHARSDANAVFSFPRIESADELRFEAHASGVLIAPLDESVAGRTHVEVTLRAERATRLRLRATDAAGAELNEMQSFVRLGDGRLAVPVDGPGAREFALRAGTAIDVIVFGRVAVDAPWLRGERHVLVPAEPTTIDVVAYPCTVAPLDKPGDDVSWLRWNGISRLGAERWVFGSTLDLSLLHDDGTPFHGTITMRRDGGSFRGEVKGRMWVSQPPGQHRLWIRGDRTRPVVVEFVGSEGGVIAREVKFEKE